MSEHLLIPEGTTWERGWPVVRFDDAGDPHGVSLAGYTVRSQVRRTPDSAGILHEWSSEAENARIDTRLIEVWDRHHRQLYEITTDLIVLHVDPWVSAAWTWAQGVWDIKTYGPAPDFWEDRIGGGTVEVTQAVTRDQGDPPPLPPPPSLVIDHGSLTGLLDDDHPQYQLRAEEGVAGGYAGLDGAAKVPIGQLPTGTTSGTVAAGNDPRLSDSRVPTVHAHPESDVTNLTSDLAGKVSKGGDTIGGAVILNSTGATGTDPLGMTGALPTGLNIRSSYAGGDDDGTGTDSTGRLNLYSYQRANVRSFGETIREYIMRSDAKAMQAFYVPVQANKKGGYDATTRTPQSSGVTWKPVVWQGAHYEANDHGSIHGHWELEVADSSGALQGRLEIPFIDQSKLSNGIDSTTIGVDYTNIRTNQADLSVRAQNITTGDYAGQTTCFRVGGGNDKNKDIRLSISSDMQASGDRWKIRANTDTESGTNAGTNLQILRCADDGTQLGTPLFIQRSDGQTTMGAAAAKHARLGLIWGTSGWHGVSAQPSVSPGAGAAFDAQMTASADRVVQSLVTGDATRRYTVLADGRTEWGNGTNARDTFLYRTATGRLKTDGEMYVATRLGVGAVPDGISLLTATQNADANALNLLNTTASGNTSGPLLRGESATASSLLATSRVTGDTTARLSARVDGQLTWGDGANPRDTNLYRSAADTLKTDDSLVVGANLVVSGTATIGGQSIAAPPVPAAGNYVWTTSPFAATTSATLGNGTLRLAPWLVERTITIVRIGAEITAAGDIGSKLRPALYADNGAAFPGALLLDPGQISGDSAIVQELTVNLTLQPGLYWIGAVLQSVTTTQPTVRVPNQWTPPVLLSIGASMPAANNTQIGYSQSGVTGALPANFTTSLSTAGTAPRIFVKLA